MHLWRLLAALPEGDPFMDNPKIAVIGGGTGSYTVLQGLKGLTEHLTAIVSVADDGGSSGRLRDEFGHLPPGDLRKCLLALSPSGDSEDILRRLLDYRFDRGNGLTGHNFGNLLLTALTEITGSSVTAIEEVSKLLNIKGAVLPVTTQDTRLMAVLEDGTVVQGETNVDMRTIKPEIPIDRIYLEPSVTAYEPTLSALMAADAIIIGPGDLYSSVIPNLLVSGIPEAINTSKATVIFVCNLMTKHGETDGFRASTFLKEILKVLGPSGRVDYCLIDDVEYEPDLVDVYSSERSFPIVRDTEECTHYAGSVRMAPLSCCGTLIRHDPQLLGNEIMQITNQIVEVRR